MYYTSLSDAIASTAASAAVYVCVFAYVYGSSEMLKNLYATNNRRTENLFILD